jgi:hypothetical protein
MMFPCLGCRTAIRSPRNSRTAQEGNHVKIEGKNHRTYVLSLSSKGILGLPPLPALNDQQVCPLPF